MARVIYECVNCCGTGQVYDGWEDTTDCPKCNGSGALISCRHGVKNGNLCIDAFCPDRSGNPSTQGKQDSVQRTKSIRKFLVSD